MAKAIKTAIIATVVAVATIYTAGAILSVLPGAAAAAAAASLAGVKLLSVAALTFTSTLIASGVGMLMNKGIGGNRANFGTKTTSRQPIAPRQIIYGKARVGGAITHLEVTGSDNQFLSMVVVISGHAVEGFTKVFFNDTELSTSSSTVSGETVFNVNTSEFSNTENADNFGSGALTRFTFHDGTQTAHDGLARARLGSTSIPDTHKYIDCAYFYIEMIYDAEKMNSIPQISFEVKGKNIYDPRTGAAATTDLQRSNPALQIRDYLSDTTYGIRATSDELNDTTNAGGFAAAANTCDQNVTLADGSSTERRYTSNGFTNMAAAGDSVLQGLMSAMGGRLTYTNGVFNLFAGAAQTPSLTITDDNLLAPVQVQTRNSQGDLYNSVKGIFVDASNNYIAGESPVLSDTTMLSQDTPPGTSSNNFKKTLEVNLPYTTTNTMAQRLAKIQLKYQRQTMVVSVRVGMEFFRLQPNDFVRMTNERLSFTNKLFEVQDMKMALDPTEEGYLVAAVDLTLREIADSVWDFATNEYTAAIGEGSAISTGDFSINAPTIGTLTQRATIQGPHTIIDIIVTWTNRQSDAVQGTEIQYKLSSESDYAVATVAGKGQTKGVIQNVVVGATYNVKLRHFSYDNVYSALSSQANITIAESDTLAQPSSVSATTGKPFFIELKWTNPANTNLRAVEVHASTTSGFTPSTGTLVNSYYGDVGKNKRVLLGKSSDFGFDYGTTFFFKLRAINVLGTATAYTSQVSGSFTKAVSADIDSISANQITAGTIDASQIDVENLNASEITAGEININRLPSAVVFTSELTDGSTVIDGSNIQTGEITLTSGDGTNNLAHIKGGKTSYEDTSNEGFFMGFNASNHPAFNIGTGTDFLKYDQSNGLTLRGTLTAGDITSGGTLSGVNMEIGSSNSIFKATSSGIQLGHATFSSAPFRVTPAGALTATNATLNGSLTSGSGNSIFKATTTGIQLGHATFSSAPFRVTAAGALTATNATITGSVTSTSGTIGGFTLGSTSLTAGTGATRVAISTADGIHLGNNSFSSAPFRVDRAGNLTATSATITGGVTATSFAMSGGALINAGDIRRDSSFFTVVNNNLALADDGVTSDKIATSLQSSNYSAGSAGWKIQKSGNAEFNGVVLSRQLLVDSGTFSPGNQNANKYGNGSVYPRSTNPTNDPNLELDKTFFIETNTGSSSWGGTNTTFIALVDFFGSGGSTVVAWSPDASSFPSDIQWGAATEVMPVSRYSGNARVFIKLEVFTRNVYSFNISFGWKLYQVT